MHDGGYTPRLSLGKRRKFRKRRRKNYLKRQQPERKEKYRERQCRANRKQHPDLSKLSVRHDMQRQRCLTPMHSTASTVIARRDLYAVMDETLALEFLYWCCGDTCF